MSIETEVKKLQEENAALQKELDAQVKQWEEIDKESNELSWARDRQETTRRNIEALTNLRKVQLKDDKLVTCVESKLKELVNDLKCGTTL